MNPLKTLALAFMCTTFFAIGAEASATNLYLAQNGTGAANGADCADATPVSFFSSSGNWGTGPGQIGPATTVHLCGTITGAANSTMLTFLGSGTSGHPVTVLFEAGAILQSPYWNSAGAIVCNSKAYVVVDGGSNGIIQNTANGSASLGYAYQQPSAGVQFGSCSHSEIRNLTVTNIYVHAPGDTSPTDQGNGPGIGIGSGYGDFASIHNNTVSDAYVGIGLGYNTVASGGNITSANIYGNTIDRACHMLNIGDGTYNSSASGINVYSNTIGPNFNTWIYANSACHSDGMIISAYNSGSQMTNSSFYSNTVTASTCTSSGGNFTGYIFMTGAMSNITIFNNVLAGAATSNGCLYEALLRLDAVGNSMTNFGIYNNVFDGSNLPSTGADVAAIKTAPTSTGSDSGFTLKNNIFVNLTNQALLNEAGTFSSVYNNGIDHNIYYNDGKIGVDWTGNLRYFALSDWQAAGFDQNGTAANPGLNSNYFPQSGSPAIGLGANLTGLNILPLDVDKTGAPRVAAGAWTVGAYQIASGAPQPPSGLTAIIN
jgi:hypothetical protein